MKVAELSLVPVSKLQMSDNELFAYAAGLIDGEGYIGIVITGRARGYKGYSLQVKVGMTTTEGIGILQLLFGGGIHIAEKPGKRAVCVWSVNARTEVEYCLNKLKGKLIIKRELAVLGLEYLRIPTNTQDPTLRETFWKQFKELNRRGV